MGVADDIADLLVTGGLSTTIQVGELRAEPSKAAVVTPTPGLPTLRTLGGAVLEQLSIQVRARASDYPTADALMTTIHSQLEGRKDLMINGRLYHWIVGAQSPFYLGPDALDRPVFSVNYDVLRAAG